MDDVFGIMLDVSGLVTRGSDRARAEARQIAAERQRRVAVDEPTGKMQGAGRRLALILRRVKSTFLPHWRPYRARQQGQARETVIAG